MYLNFAIFFKGLLAIFCIMIFLYILAASLEHVFKFSVHLVLVQPSF